MNKIIVQISEMSLSHIDILTNIAKDSRENFWTRNIIKKFLGRKNHSGLVAIYNDEIVGYVGVQNRYKEAYVQIWDMVIINDLRRMGVGRQLIQALIVNIPDQFEGIRFNVRESNKPVQLFLKSMKFWCEAIFRNYFTDKTFGPSLMEDAYCFDYNPSKERKKNEPLRIICSTGTYVSKHANCPSNRNGSKDDVFDGNRHR